MSRDTSTRWSITDFLTNGSLAALADRLAHIVDQPISLHAFDGRRIATVSGEPRWIIEEPSDRDPDITRLISNIDTQTIARDRERSIVPIMVAGQPAGALVTEFKGQDPQRREMIESLLLGVAESAAEFCDENVVTRRQTSELQLLLRLSSLLVSVSDLDQSLKIALDSSADILRADAATIHLLDEPEDLHLHAGFGVSEQFKRRVELLPRDSVIDQAVLRGDVITVPDLHLDGKALHLDQLKAEGLVGMISVGLVFRTQAFGIMRFYSRAVLAPEERRETLVRAVAEQVAAAIAGAHLVESERKRRQTKRTLKLAADIQRRMLPNAAPDIKRLDIAARYEPSLELGGDFYDLIDLSGHLGVVVCDVVGKGIPAALLMASVRATLRAHATDVYHINEVIKRVNKALARDTHDNEFATLFYGVIDPASLRLTYCNAGHDPPIIVRPTPGAEGSPIEIHRLPSGGMVVGIDETQPYENAVFNLQPGDTLIAFTDGVTDALNFDGEKFGINRLLEAIHEIFEADQRPSAELVVSNLSWRVNRFSGMRTKTDDVTIVCVRVAT